jgi:hypothetical protein
MKKTLLETIVALIALLFTYTAISKFMDFETFQVQLAQSPLTTGFATIISWLIPVSELLISIGLVIKRYRYVSLYAALFLMTIFTAYVYSILNYSYYIPCSCGGIVSTMDWTTHLWFNLGFVALSVIAILLNAGIEGGNRSQNFNHPGVHPLSDAKPA